MSPQEVESDGYLCSSYFLLLHCSGSQPRECAVRSGPAFALSLPNQNNPPEAFPGAHLPRDSGFSQVDN